MQRYRINTPLVAIRLFEATEAEKPGVMTSLPEDAIVEAVRPSDLGRGMIEVLWAQHRYAVFEQDLIGRATLLRGERTARA